MTYINVRYQDSARDMLLEAVENLYTACGYIDRIIADNEGITSDYTLLMIDDADLLTIYIRQIERIVKEV